MRPCSRFRRLVLADLRARRRAPEWDHRRQLLTAPGSSCSDRSTDKADDRGPDPRVHQRADSRAGGAPDVTFTGCPDTFLPKIGYNMSIL